MKIPNLCSLIVGCASIGSLPAANIAWVSFHPGDNTPSTAAASAGFTQAPDIGYTNLLATNGHTVTRFVGSNNPNAAVLNGFDLVIVSRSTDSGNFSGAGAVAWNQNITVPMIIMSGYAMRSNRLGLTSGETMLDTFVATDAVTDSIRLTASNPLHPIFNGVALDGGNTMVNDFATEMAIAANVQFGISVNTSALAGGGTLIATVGTTTDPASGGAIIAEWSAGANLTHTGGPSVLAGDRLVFLSGSRERGVTTNAAGIFDLTADGSTMFLNAVNYMTIPETSGIVLIAFGASAFLRRRRR